MCGNVCVCVGVCVCMGGCMPAKRYAQIMILTNFN